MRLGDRLISELQNDRWQEVRASVAFVKMSGVRHIANALFAFARRGGKNVWITVGIDQQGSSLEGVQTLWQILGDAGHELSILHNPATNPQSTFHPKVWLFEADDLALLVSGSGNLTGGGLFTNYEFGTAIELDLFDDSDRRLHDVVRRSLDAWADFSRPEVVPVTAQALFRMHESGELPSESAIRSAHIISRGLRAAVAGVARGTRAASGLFSGHALDPAPESAALPSLPPPPVTPKPAVRLPGKSQRHESAKPLTGGSDSAEGAAVPEVEPVHDELLIVVNPRNKTEIFLAKVLLQEDPAFFGWPFLGLTVPKRSGNFGQPQPDPLPTAEVRVFRPDGSLAGHIIDDSLKLWTYSFGPSANDDFRLTLIGGLQRKVPDGSILVMVRQPSSGYDYDISIYPPGHAEYQSLYAECTEVLRGSSRRYGWR